ncbi:mechanosensitive ion channel, partial [bacterium]|nr:mechanosensitive ion channel [bacterium]
METIHNTVLATFNSLGLRNGVATLLVAGIILFVALLADIVSKRILLSGLSAIIGKTKTQVDDLLLQKKVFHRLSHMAPAFVIYWASELLFPALPTVQSGIRAVCIAYMVIIGALVIESCLSVFENILSKSQPKQSVVIRSSIQVLKIALYLLTGIFVLATLMDKSPWAFISGIGAMTAILMLVFKDSILGFVASVQVSFGDMVRPGDWIEMPKYGADGNVIDVSLNTIRIQNWDNTIVSVPTYSLVSDSFKNWRGMSESGGRRIKHTLTIDMNSVSFCKPEQLDQLKQITILNDYLSQKESEI